MAKILIVDDVESERRLVSTVLSSSGHTVTTATNGSEAITAMEQAIPDLVILDVVMPGKSGFDVCRNIRKHEKLGKVPVIMLTSKNQDSDKFWAQKQGASEYLTKPFEPAALLAAVKRFV